MQSLTLQAEKLATFCQGDGSLSLFGTDVKQNSIYDGCFEAISGNANYQTDGQHNFNQLCTETLEKTAEVAFGNIESQQQAKNPSQTSDVGECLYNPRYLKIRDPGEPAEQSGVAESHFEEELLELGCPSAGLVTGKHTQRALIIQVIPPSPCGSDDTRKEGSPKCVRNRLSSSKVKRKQASQDSAISALPNSALTVTFGSDRRTLHIKDNLDLTSKVTDVSERGDLGSPEMKEIKKEVQRMSLAVGHSFSRPALSHCIDETIQSCSDREQVGIEDPECSVNTTLSHANDSRMDQETEGRRKQVCKTEKLEKHNVVKGKWVKHFLLVCLAPHDINCMIYYAASLEPKELLKPTIHQDSDSSGSDHWAVRRKLFKENRPWSSAGGGSITSDITEDSGTSILMSHNYLIVYPNPNCNVCYFLILYQ